MRCGDLERRVLINTPSVFVLYGYVMEKIEIEPQPATLMNKVEGDSGLKTMPALAA